MIALCISLMMMADTVAVSDTPVAVPDTLRRPMERVDTLREIEVRPDSSLPMMKAIQSSLNRQNIQAPPSLGDILEKIAPGINDKICHPFAIKQRRRERKHKRDRKILEHYDQVKTFDDLLREAIVREGLQLPEEKEDTKH